jgi:Mor family transcriptional regulator
VTSIIKEMQEVVSRVVGDDDIARNVVYALIKQFGGYRIYMPCNDYELRNKEIVELYKNGTDINLISMRYHLSSATIRRVVRVFKNKK